MLMRCCIKRLFSYPVLALCAAILLLSLSSAAYARSPFVGKHTIFDEIVEADPGEDPHLMVDPQVDPGLSRDLYGGTSSSTSNGVDGVIRGGYQETGSKAGTGRTRVKTKLLNTLQSLFGRYLR
jgi:hypothetical protein